MSLTTSSRTRQLAFAIVQISALLAASLAHAQQYVSVEIEGEVPEELRDALSSVVDPTLFERVLSRQAANAVSYDTLCDIVVCDDLPSESNLEHVWRGGNPNHPLHSYQLEASSRAPGSRIGGTFRDSIVLPEHIANQRGYPAYVMVGSHDDLYEKYVATRNPGLSPLPDYPFVGVPIPYDIWAEQIRTGSVSAHHPADTWLSPINWSAPPDVPPGPWAINDAPNTIATWHMWFPKDEDDDLDILDQDIQLSGKTRRQFRIDDSASASDIERLRETASDLNSITVTIGEEPKNEFEIALGKISFEADVGVCGDTPPNWPYDAAAVAETLDFNRRVLEQLGIRHLTRTNILVIDSGVGTALADDGALADFLFGHTGELLYSEYYHSDSTLVAKVCLDIDGNELTSDAYGFAPEKALCRSKGPLQRLAPIPKLGGIRSPEYFPEHGSFVAGLAIGGPELIDSYDGLSDLVGLTFARVTQMPISDRQSVKTDIGDLKAALHFATERNVDIINASLRTSNGEYKSELVNALEKFDGLVVAAAGNFPQELTSDSPVFPAAATGMIRGNENLIVVGALQPNIEDPWWPNSAFSERMVDIAAPGHRIVSFNEAGEKVCMSGTSAAAPLVTFTAGILQAYGLSAPKEIHRRILATADYEPSLDRDGRVSDGRVLHANRAIDVFADYIWFENVDDPVRAEIVRPDRSRTKPVLLQLCKAGSGIFNTSRGMADLAALVYWNRLPQDELPEDDSANAEPLEDAGELVEAAEAQATEVEVWHRLFSEMSDQDLTCNAGDGAMTYVDLADGSLKTVNLSSVTRIVPSPLRKATESARLLAVAPDPE